MWVLHTLIQGKNTCKDYTKHKLKFLWALSFALLTHRSFHFSKIFPVIISHLLSFSPSCSCFRDFPHNPRPKYDDHDQQTFSSFNTCKGSRFLWKLKYCQQNKNHLVAAHTSKNMICSTWLDIPFSSYMEKVICAIWLAVGFLDQLLNQIYFFPFQWVNLSMFIINSAISSG